MRRTSSIWLGLVLLTACSKPEAPSAQEGSKPAAEAEREQVPGMDPDLAKAVAAASSKARGAAAPQSAEAGPPLDGVFAPGAADKEIAKGALPKITLGAVGADPKVALRVPPKPGQKLAGTIQIAQQTDPRQGALPVLFTVALETKKAEGSAAEDASAAVNVTVKVNGARIDAPGVPKDLDEQIGRLKGSKVEYTLLPDGVGTGYRFETPKNVPEDLQDVVRSLSDSLALLTIPYPAEPLGAGGYFMVTSRDELMGTDLVSYRLVKVTAVTPKGASIEVSTKRYSASRTFNFPGLPPDISKNLQEFQAQSDGKVEVVAGALLPTQGEVSSGLAAALGEPEAKQRMMLQLQTRAQLALEVK